MTDGPMPTLVAKQPCSFSIPRENNSFDDFGGSSESDEDVVGGASPKRKVGVGNGLSGRNSEDERERPSNERKSSLREDIGIALQNSSSKPIKVIVVSDVICPWCYVALREIQLAIQDLTLSCLDSVEQLPPPKFDIEFRPFFLNDNFGSDDIAVDRRAFLESKFGAERLDEVEKKLKDRGKVLGIDFKIGGMLRQTTRSHRLLTLAYRTGGSALQLALLEHLFHAMHVEEKDIGNVELLAYYADKVGLLPKAMAEKWLRTHDLETDVRRLVKISVQGCGITGVPFVVINGKWAIGGCEERSVYYKVFEKIWKGSLLSAN